MSKVAKAQVGDIVRIVFLDHCEVGFEESKLPRGAIVFEVFGRVLVSRDDSYDIGHWLYENMLLEPDDNNEGYTIVKSAIKELQILVDINYKRDKIDK